MPDEEPVDFQRLGKSDLGRHAFEEQMPVSIAQALRNETEADYQDGVVQRLVQLLELDSDVQEAYLCTERVLQISKLSHEGAHFCGYRNIQMMWSALPAERLCKLSLSVSTPNVLALQELIETAWDSGYNAHGKQLTGGISGTRKHIGTSEAEALCLYLGIPCTGRSFQGDNAWKELIDSVEAYLSSTSSPSKHTKIHTTDQSPIFLQRPHHSLTIVGLERLRSGKRRLLAFDPAWQPPSAVRKLQNVSAMSPWSRKWLLQRYRKNERYLKRFDAFETLEIDILK